MGSATEDRMALATTTSGVPAVKSKADDTFAPMAGFDASDKSGKEGITAEDWRPAFLCIAQMTSKVKDDTDDAYIEGIKLGDMYNSETKDIYGRGPVEVQLLRHRKRAYLPDENGRQGEEIPWDDPRCEWPTEDQKRTWIADGKKGKPKPEGVRVYDWVVLLLNGAFPQLAVVSFKSKSFTAGQTITKFAGMVQGPSYAAKFAISTQLKENEAGKFGVFSVAPAGKPTQEQAEFAQRMYENVKDRVIPSEDTGDHDDVEGSANSTAASDKIPF
jgi:hypothetical protein